MTDSGLTPDALLKGLPHCSEAAALERLLAAIEKQFAVEIVEPKSVRDPFRIRVDALEFDVRIFREYMGRMHVGVSYWGDRILVRPRADHLEAAMQRVANFVGHAVEFQRQRAEAGARLKAV